MRTACDLVRLAAERTPDALAIVDDRAGRSLTYRGLLDEIDAVAAGLESRGIRAQARVQPGAGVSPVPFRGALGEVEHFRRLTVGKSREEPQFN